MKKELLQYLKGRNIKEIEDLWSEVKHYFKSKQIEIGGSYSSWSKHVNVIYYEGENKIKFKVSLDEFQK